MTLQEFFNENDGKFVDFDGVYGAQCVDIVNKYVTEVLGIGSWGGNAIDKWTNYPQDHFDRVENSPSNMPQPGDIVIWGTGIGQYGHIDIAARNINLNSFIGFDQNWPLQSPCHFQGHDYTHILGWLHPKVKLPPPSPPQPTEPNTSNPPTMSENDTIVGMLPGLHRGQFKLDGDTTFYSVIAVPDPHWELDILKQDPNKLVTLPSDWPVDPAFWLDVLFKNCYMNQVQAWPSDAEIAAWKASGIAPYTWVEQNAPNPLRDADDNKAAQIKTLTDQIATIQQNGNAQIAALNTTIDGLNKKLLAAESLAASHPNLDPESQAALPIHTVTFVQELEKFLSKVLGK